MGRLLNVFLGSLAEVVLALFVLAHGDARVVQAQITGSIIGTSLFGLGLTVVVGSIGRERQVFKRERAGQLSSMLIRVMVALLLSAVFNFVTGANSDAARPKVTDEEFSIGVPVVLILLYAGNLLYTLVTHRDVFASDDARGGGTDWPLPASLGVMGTTTAAVALEAELVSGTLEATAGSLDLATAFLGVVVLALVGTASGVFAAAVFARQDKMGLVLNVCVGSSIQVALVGAPLLVLTSWAIGWPVTLVFDNPLDLFADAAAAFTVNPIAADGETTWSEGMLLIGVYALLGLAFFFRRVSHMFFHSWTGLARVPIVGVLAYVALVLFIRISGKRTLTKLNAFDLVVTVALGSTLSSVLLNDSVALAEGIVAMATLIGLQFLVTFASVRSSYVESVVKSEPTLLLRDGHFLDAVLKAQRVTRDEVRSALRSEGISDVEAIHAVVLEADGSMSVLEDRLNRAAAPTLSNQR